MYRLPASATALLSAIAVIATPTCLCLWSGASLYRSYASMSPPLVVVVLSLLLGLQPAASDLYLPALPAIVLELDGTISQAQYTLSGMLLSFGLSQLFWGPISDKYGRKPVLLVGVSLYVLAALGATFSMSLESLVIWRCLQGIGVGAGVVCGRALIRDLFSGEQGARTMSKGMTGLGAIACASAPLGALVAGSLGWRAALGVLVIFGACALTLIALKLQETLTHPDSQALSPSRMASNWIRILSNRTFWAFGILATSSYCTLFVFLAASSFVLMDLLQLSGLAYGFLMCSMSASYIVGTVLCRRLLRQFSVQRTVAIAGALSLAGGTLLGGLALLGIQNLWSLMLPIYIVLLGHGVHQPCGQTGAVSPFPKAAGVAAALSGCITTLTAFLTGLWLGPSMDGTVYPLTNGMWFWTCITAIAAWGPVQWLSKPDKS